MYSLILLAGGTGTRMQQSVPKQYLLLAGKPVIMHTIERIDRIEEIQKIVIVCTDDYVQIINEMLRQYAIHTPIQYAAAGSSRQASVWSGLQCVDTERVILHEAARPFVSEEDFRRLINEEADHVMFGVPIPFTVLKGHEYVEELLDRTELVNVQLPQKFLTRDLYHAHRQAVNEGKRFTEDAGMVFTYAENQNVKVLQGKEYNIKLTTPMDLLIGEIIYKEYFARKN